MKTISNLDNSFHTFIYSISLTTFLDGCAALVEQAKALYSNDPAFKCGDIVGAPGADNLDRIDRINASDPVNPVQTVASQSAVPESGFDALAGALTEDEIKIVEGSISGEKNAEGSKT